MSGLVKGVKTVTNVKIYQLNIEIKTIKNNNIIMWKKININLAHIESNKS